MSIVRGTYNPLLQRTTERFSPSTGYTREFEWRGISEARARAYFNAYNAAGLESEFTVAHGIATLVTTDATGSYTIDTWEVGVNQTLVSSLKNPRNLATIPAANLDVLARAYRDGSTFEEAADSLEEETGDIYDPDITDPEALRLWRRMLAGGDSYFHDQYVLRHTTNVSNRWDVNVSDFNKGCIYTHAQLLTEVLNPNSWIYPMPGRLKFKLDNAAVDNAPAAVANYLWGWLKGASPESTAANNRVNIVTEYKLFSWSTDEYSTV